jgi:hypothetical protein
VHGDVDLVCVLQAMEEELKKLGLKVRHHEGNIKFLKSELNAVEEACVDLASKLLTPLRSSFS